MKLWLQGVLSLSCVACLALSAQLLLHNRPAQQHWITLAPKLKLRLIEPSTPSTRLAILLTQPGTVLNANALSALSQRLGIRFAELASAGDCQQQQAQLKQIEQQFGAAELVAGLGSSAESAGTWLAEQNDPHKQALSVGLNLSQTTCPAPVPTQGHWQVAWNDNPDDDTARLLREQSAVETQIADYDTPLPDLLIDQLEQRLDGNRQALPLIEVGAAEGDTRVLFYSGDGGWRDLDRDVAGELAQRGLPTLGIDTLRYFWQHKSPEQSAHDLAQLMQRLNQEQGVHNFILIGYSFGADVLPALYNRLPSAQQAQTRALVLLALARSASFEIKVQGWLGKDGEEAATGPELAKLPKGKVLCVYGQEEKDESGCTQSQAQGTVLELPGGHHFDQDYPKLAERIIQFIKQTPTLNAP